MRQVSEGELSTNKTGNIKEIKLDRNYPFHKIYFWMTQADDWDEWPANYMIDARLTLLNSDRTVAELDTTVGTISRTAKFAENMFPSFGPTHDWRATGITGNLSNNLLATALINASLTYTDAGSSWPNLAQDCIGLNVRGFPASIMLFPKLLAAEANLIRFEVLRKQDITNYIWFIKILSCTTNY